MIMEITLLIMEKSWNFVFKFLWEPCSQMLFKDLSILPLATNLFKKCALWGTFCEIVLNLGQWFKRCLKKKKDAVKRQITKAHF